MWRQGGAVKAQDGDTAPSEPAFVHRLRDRVRAASAYALMMGSKCVPSSWTPVSLQQPDLDLLFRAGTQYEKQTAFQREFALIPEPAAEAMAEDAKRGDGGGTADDAVPSYPSGRLGIRRRRKRGSGRKRRRRKRRPVRVVGKTMSIPLIPSEIAHRATHEIPPRPQI